VRPLHQPLWWAAGALAAVPLLYPIINPDLFWHLSAGRWMVDHGALPRADFLSFTAEGRPWIDFEWLGQLVFLAAHCAGGLTGVWLLKILLLCASAALLERTLARRGCGLPLRLAALALWSGGMLAHSDIRPDLFSLILLGTLVHAGETGRLKNPSAASLAGVFLLFLLWPNLHGGFPLGWFLLGCYALAAGPRRLGSWLPLSLAIPATVLNPYGWGPWKVLLLHWTQSADISRVIAEWKPLDFTNPVYLPVWGLLALAAFGMAFTGAVCFRLGGKQRPSWPLLAATAAMGLMTLRHERSCAYFAVCAATLLPLLARDMGWEDAPWTRRIAAGWALAYGMFLVWLVPKAVWTTEFDYKFVPRAAAEFMARERKVLEPLRLYNQWEWGGYLAWRLRPWYRVYWDGRYIFQGELAEAERAIRGPEDWRAFMDRGRLDGALLVNLSRMLPAQKRYPDGSLRDFPRPWYVFFMPRERWALVYWDRKALLFVDRRKVPEAWLAAREYRYARPGDGSALLEAMRLQEAPASEVRREDERHERELDEFDARRRP
jgi:hypothetical protein